MNKVMLISPNDIKSESTVNFNVDDAVIGATIRNVQKMYMEEIVGTHLMNRLIELTYNTIKGEADSFDNPQNEVYSDLYYNYYKPAAIAKTVTELIAPILFKIRNVGLTKNTDTNVLVANLEEMRYNQSYYNAQFNTYATRLSHHMEKVKNQIIEIGQCRESGDLKPQIGRDYVSNGIWLGGDNNDCKCR